MAGNDTAALVVAMSAQLTKFEKDMDNAYGIADRSAQKIEARFNKINPNAPLTDFISQLRTVAAAGGVAEAVRIISDLNLEVAKIGDHAAAVGLTTDEFQRFRFAVVATGGSIEAADRFLAQFANHLSQAAKGHGDLYNFLKINNVALRDNNGQLLPANTLLEKYSDLVKRTKSPLDQMNEAVMVAGRNAGPELVNALKLGSDGLRDLGVQAEAAGVVLDAALIERAKKANEQFQVLKLQSTTLFEELAVSFTQSSQKFVQEAGKAGDDAGFAQSMQKFVKDADKAGSDLNSKLKSWWDQAIKYIEGNSPDLAAAVRSSLAQIEAARSAMEQATRNRNFDQGKSQLLAGEGKPLGTQELSKFPGYQDAPGVEAATKQFNVQADAFRKLIELQEQRIQLLHAEATAQGLAVGPAAALTEKVRLETEAKQKDIPLTKERIAAIEAEAQKIGKATQALEAMKVASQIDFGRKTAFLTPEDVQIAQQLKGLYGNDIPAALASSQAAALRLNAIIADASAFTRDLAKSFASDIRTAIQNGAKGWEVFQQAAINALNKIADKLASIAIDQLWSKAFGGLGGSFFGLLGGPGGGGGAGLGGAGLAGGTLSWRGGTVLVGEHGPEVVDLPAGASVTPVGDLPRFPSVAPIAPSSSGGGVTVEIYPVAGSAFDQSMNGDKLVLVQRMIDDSIDANNRSLPTRVFAINADPRKR